MLLETLHDPIYQEKIPGKHAIITFIYDKTFRKCSCFSQSVFIS